MDLQNLYESLKEAGQLGDFLELAAGATGLFNCTVESPLAEGPRGNLYVRKMHPGKQGESVEGHRHNYDHVSMLLSGKVVMGWKRNDEDPWQEQVFQAPAEILVRKGCLHRFTSLTNDVIIHCVYAIRDSVTGEFTETWDGSKQPYV